MADSHPHLTNLSRQILVVDDDPSIRLVCVKSLRSAGYLVLEAEGSSEAMALYSTATAPIDLLLTDMFLPPPGFQLSSTKTQYPRVNGHDLVRQALSVKQELRVLFMSSHSVSSLATQGITVKPERFIQKPFSVEDLLKQVAATLAAPPIRVEVPAATAQAKDVRWFD
jgi:CheY-like chemotaxis protein